jgi:hypothetical protein
MKCGTVRFIRRILSLLLLAFLLYLPLSEMARAANVLVLKDNFNGANGTPPNPKKWDMFDDNPIVVILSGGAGTPASIQSKPEFKFGYGIMQMAITSADWQQQTLPPCTPSTPTTDLCRTDSSFGFEIWRGANGKCHYGVILVANGHLGLLRAQPDADGNCSGDPVDQAHIPISNWDAVHAGGTVHITLTWAPKGVTLYVSAGNTNDCTPTTGSCGIAFYLGPAEPTNRLRIRLNAKNVNKVENL